MLGNDVVDLRDPETRPAARHPRFDERVFDAAERRWIDAGARPEARRWRLWAAKEAAFKAGRRRDASLRFAPRRYPVTPHSEEEAEVHGPAGRTRVRWTERGGCIHAVAAADARGVETALSRSGPRDPSRAVRDLARACASRRLGVAASRVSVGKRDGVPLLLCDGAPAGLLLSLSHHGGIVACALAAEAGDPR